MCALCGVLGGEGDWVDASGITIPAASLTRRAQRQERVRLANSVLRQFGLALADWQGAKYQLAKSQGAPSWWTTWRKFGRRRSAF